MGLLFPFISPSLRQLRWASFVPLFLHHYSAEDRSRFERITLMSIDGELPDPCDDFECKSSPTIEQGIRSIARALARNQTVDAPMLMDKVSYQELFLNFQGKFGYQEATALFKKDTQGLLSRVNSMKMLPGKGDTVEIKWRMQGAFKGKPFVVNVVDVLTLNLITGRVEKQKRTWDFKNGGSGGTGFLLNRTLLGAQVLLKVQQEKQRLAEEAKNNTDSGSDSYGVSSSGMPSDPTKFFSNSSDNFQQDAILFCLGVAVLYFLTKGLEAVNTMGSGGL